MTPGLSHATSEGRDELTPDEARDFLEDQTQRYLGISLEEFMRRAEADDLPDHPMVEHLVLLTGARAHSC